MKNLIVSSVGTSLLNHAAGGLDLGASEKEVTRPGMANLRDEEFTQEQRAVMTRVEAAAARLLAEGGERVARKISAELNGLLGFVAIDRSGHNGDHHILVCTDTRLGGSAGGILADWLRNQGASAQVLIVAGLTTRSLPDFRLAMAELARQLIDLIPSYRDQGYRIIFNLSGGFKSVQGFLQTLGALHADETIYIFEGSPDVLSIPRLPIRLEADDVVRDNLDIFCRLAHRYVVTPDEVVKIADVLVFRFEGETTLSEWGTVLFETLKPRFYAVSIRPPLNEHLVLTPRFLEEANHLPPVRRVMVNNQLDALAIAVNRTRATNSKSLSLKPLHGNPVPGATHEFYLWSDGDAKRGFGSFEDGQFVVLGRVVS